MLRYSESQVLVRAGAGPFINVMPELEVVQVTVQNYGMSKAAFPNIIRLLAGMQGSHMSSRNAWGQWSYSEAKSER
jgi:hypothetical protein